MSPFFSISFSNKILIPTSTYSQKSSSIHPRTSLSKFGSYSIHLIICLLNHEKPYQTQRSLKDFALIAETHVDLAHTQPRRFSRETRLRSSRSPRWLSSRSRAGRRLCGFPARAPQRRARPQRCGPLLKNLAKQNLKVVILSL